MAAATCRECWMGHNCILPARHRGAHVSASSRQQWMGRRKPLSVAALAEWKRLVARTLVERAGGFVDSDGSVTLPMTPEGINLLADALNAHTVINGERVAP